MTNCMYSVWSNCYIVKEFYLVVLFIQKKKLMKNMRRKKKLQDVEKKKVFLIKVPFLFRKRKIFLYMYAEMERTVFFFE